MFVGGACVGFISLYVLKGYTRNSSNGSNFTENTREIAMKDHMAPQAPQGGMRAQVQYDYTAAEAGELSLKAGSFVTVTAKSDDGWWTGRLANGTTGVFPSNYVTMV